jgi:hypothetical protein
MSRTVGAVLFVVYIIIGAIVAGGHHYFEHLNAVRPIASAVLAVLLSPLVLSESASTSNRAIWARQEVSDGRNEEAGQGEGEQGRRVR